MKNSTGECEIYHGCFWGNRGEAIDGLGIKCGELLRYLEGIGSELSLSEGRKYAKKRPAKAALL